MTHDKITFDEEIQRLKDAIGIKTDTELGQFLGKTQGAISAAKGRKCIPPSWIKQIALKLNINSHDLFFGERPIPQYDVDTVPSLRTTIVNLEKEIELLKEVIATQKETIATQKETIVTQKEAIDTIRMGEKQDVSKSAQPAHISTQASDSIREKNVL